MTFEEWWYTYKRWGSFHNVCMEDAIQDAFKAGQRSVLDMWPKDGIIEFERLSHCGADSDLQTFYHAIHFIKDWLQQKLSREGEGEI